MRILSVAMFGIATASTTISPASLDLTLAEVTSSTTGQAPPGLGAAIAGFGQSCVDGVCSAARSVQELYESGIARWNQMSPQDRMALLYVLRRGLDFMRGQDAAAVRGRGFRGARIENTTRPALELLDE